MKTSVSEFISSVVEWQQSKMDFCPRCGRVSDHFVESEYTYIQLCPDCFIDELMPDEENYENWAVVIALRALHGDDIKIL